MAARGAFFEVDLALGLLDDFHFLEDFLDLEVGEVLAVFVVTQCPLLLVLEKDRLQLVPEHVFEGLLA